MVVKNAKKLLIPYYMTGICVTIARGISAWIQHWAGDDIKNLIMNTLKGLIFGFGVDESIWFFPVWSIGAIWFLLAFFWNTLFMQMIFRYKEKSSEFMRGIYIVAFGAIWYIIAQYIWIPTNVDIGGFAVIFTYFGYLLAKYDVISECKSIAFWVICVILLYYCWQTGGVNMVIRLYPNVLSIVGAIAGSLLLIKVGQWVAQNAVAEKCIGWYGRNSMTILCVHLFEMMIIPWDTIGYYLLGIESSRIFVFVCRLLWATVMCILVKKGKKLLGKGIKNICFYLFT